MGRLTEEPLTIESEMEPLTREPDSMAEVLREMQARQAERAARHAERLAADPEYRREWEAEQAARQAFDLENERRERMQREAARIARIERRRVAASIPRRLWRFLDAPIETRAVEEIRKFMKPDNEQVFLILAGGVGAGKTIAGALGLDIPYRLRRALAEKDVLHGLVGGDGSEFFTQRDASALFVNAMQIVRAGTFNEEFWTRAKEADRLVIDDLGTEPLDEKGWALANLSDLLNARYHSGSKTIITTNLTQPKFRDRYCVLDGGRLLDRLREVGTFIEIPGESMRVGLRGTP